LYLYCFPNLTFAFCSFLEHSLKVPTNWCLFFIYPKTSPSWPPHTYSEWRKCVVTCYKCSRPSHPLLHYLRVREQWILEIVLHWAHKPEQHSAPYLFMLSMEVTRVERSISPVVNIWLFRQKK
jgi:hypothetical protein